jgi:hypothetical protein
MNRLTLENIRPSDFYRMERNYEQAAEDRESRRLELMSTTCTRCNGTGFLNIDQVPDAIRKTFDASGQHSVVLAWVEANENHDVSICDCCGNGDVWYGEPGEHYNANDPRGQYGPYAYNGGLCECN